MNPRKPASNFKQLKGRRTGLRNALTSAEAVLWKSLQRSQLDGKKFRRQHSIGPYVLDFYCAEHRLAVELDGQEHLEFIGSEKDASRTEYLNRLNIRVLRFENRWIFENLEGVLETIRQNLIGS